MKIQVNNRFVEPAQLAAAIEKEKMNFSATERNALTASLKADRHTPMQVIMQIKQALREAGISRINYSATQKINQKIVKKSDLKHKKWKIFNESFEKPFFFIIFAARNFKSLWQTV